MNRTAIYSTSGSAWLRQKWHFFRRQVVQKWSPLLWEVEDFYGFRFGRVWIGITFVNLSWRDGEELRREKRSYGL